MPHRQKKTFQVNKTKLRNKRKTKQQTTISILKRPKKTISRCSSFFFWAKSPLPKQKQLAKCAFHPDLSCWVLLRHVDAIDLLLLQVAPQYRWSGSSRHGASQQCQTTGTCQIADHIFLGQQTNSKHPVISSQVWCLDGMFLGFGHTKPQFRWPWISECLGKNQIEPVKKKNNTIYGQTFL